MHIEVRRRESHLTDPGSFPGFVLRGKGSLLKRGNLQNAEDGIIYKVIAATGCRIFPKTQ
jgi:hypothetical protein